jgi:hypothetical protein
MFNDLLSLVNKLDTTDSVVLILIVGIIVGSFFYNHEEEVEELEEEYVEDTPRVFDNVIYASELKTKMLSALDELSEILRDHAGPFCSNAIIGSKWRQVNDVDEFTKDGIKILLHLIVSEDAVARLVARNTRFVGVAVDRRCYDGTTTAMLMFCNLAKIAVEKIDCDLFDNSRFEWSKELKFALNKAIEYLDTLKITDEDLLVLCQNNDIETTIEEVRGSIAYHMAMISSKGDTDLSSKIATLVRSTPKNLHGTFKDNALTVETEESYILKHQEYDLGMKANLLNIQDYNYKNDTQYLAEDAVVFMSGNDIVTSSMESSFLLSFISDNIRFRSDLEPEFGVKDGWETLSEGKRNLVIIAPMVNDPVLMEAILTFNKKYPNCKITCFNVHVHGRMRTSLNKTFHYIAGRPLFNDVMESNAASSLIGLNDRNLKVHFVGNYLMVSNIYQKDGRAFHPFYYEEDKFEPYTLFRKETEELIDFAMKNITNQALDPDEVTYLSSLYRVLTCQDIYDIEIGGSIHDQYANRTVYEDAIGAALSAVKEGVILGGYAHLYQYFSQIAIDEGVDSDIALAISDALLDVLSVSLREENTEYLSGIINDDLDSKYDYLVVDTTDDEYTSEVSTLSGDTLKQFITMSEGRPILLQAYGGYNEQFRRFRDMLPKFANTTHLVDMRINDAGEVR